MKFVLVLLGHLGANLGLQLRNMGCRVVDNTLYVAGMAGNSDAKLLAMDLIGQSNYSTVAEWGSAERFPVQIHPGSSQLVLAIMQSRLVTLPSSSGMARPGSDILGSDLYTLDFKEPIRWLLSEPNKTLLGFLPESRRMVQFNSDTREYSVVPLPPNSMAADLDAGTLVRYNSTVFVLGSSSRSLLALDMVGWMWTMFETFGDIPPQLTRPSATVMDGKLYVLGQSLVFELDLIDYRWTMRPSPSLTGCLTQAANRSLILVSDNSTYIASKDFAWRAISSPQEPEYDQDENASLFIGAIVFTLVVAAFVIYIMCLRPRRKLLLLNNHRKGEILPTDWTEPSPLLAYELLRPEPARQSRHSQAYPSLDESSLFTLDPSSSSYNLLPKSQVN